VDAGGESLANQIQKVFKTVNISRDGEITFLEFQQAVANTDLFVQVRTCFTRGGRLVKLSTP
jgi:hypothetical protein